MFPPTISTVTSMPGGSAGAANGTINRELAALKRIFNLARTSTPPKVR